MEFSNRARNLQLSPIRKLIPYADKAKKAGKKVYHLNIGQPDVKTPKEFFNGIKDCVPEVISYTNSAGLLELREAFSKYYKKWNMDFETEDIIVTTGGSEALMFAMATICDPEDEIIVIEPFYANYKSFAKILNIKLSPVKACPENGYCVPEIEEFEKVLSPKTKGILFSNPSNPTGAVYTKEELSKINEFSKKHDLFIISDEVYKEFTFDGFKHLSIMNFDNVEKYIVVDSVSKKYSACGARIGCFCSKNKELMHQVMKFAQARLCSPELEQHGVVGLVENLSSKYMKETYIEYQNRRDAVYEECSKIEGAKFKKPHGAFYMAVELPVDDSENFVKFMLEDFDIDGETVMVAPLNGFYATPGFGKKEIRIAYVLSPEKLRKACSILRKGIIAYNNKDKK